MRVVATVLLPVVVASPAMAQQAFGQGFASGLLAWVSSTAILPGLLLALVLVVLGRWMHRLLFAGLAGLAAVFALSVADSTLRLDAPWQLALLCLLLVVALALPRPYRHFRRRWRARRPGWPGIR